MQQAQIALRGRQSRFGSLREQMSGRDVIRLDARLGHAPIENHAPLLLRRGITSVCLRLHHSTEGEELFDAYVPHIGLVVAGLDLECYGRKLAQPWLGFHDRMCLEKLDGGRKDTLTKVRFSIETRAIADSCEYLRPLAIIEHCLQRRLRVRPREADAVKIIYRRVQLRTREPLCSGKDRCRIEIPHAYAPIDSQVKGKDFVVRQRQALYRSEISSNPSRPFR